MCNIKNIDGEIDWIITFNFLRENYSLKEFYLCPRLPERNLNQEIEVLRFAYQSFLISLHFASFDIQFSACYTTLIDRDEVDIYLEHCSLHILSCKFLVASIDQPI